MTVPGCSEIGGWTVVAAKSPSPGPSPEYRGGEIGDSRKLPASAWAASIRSTRWLSSSSPAQASSRYARRSSSDGFSNAAKKIDSRWEELLMIGSPIDNAKTG